VLALLGTISYNESYLMKRRDEMTRVELETTVMTVTALGLVLVGFWLLG
jgi:hypothetical protein